MTVKEIIEQENHAKEFLSPFGNISVSAEKNMYAALRKKYQKLAEIASEHYGELYDKYTNCNDIYQFGERHFQLAVTVAVEGIKNDLISMGIYDLDYDTIFEKIAQFGGLDAFYSAYENITNQIDEINGTVESNRQYREERKNNRSRWEVSTYGGSWGDAIANQAEAGLMNLGSGIAHSAFNAIGNKLDEANARRELEALFQKSSLKLSLVRAVYASVFSFHLALIHLLEGCSQNVNWDTPNEEVIEKGRRMLNNLESGAIPATEENKVYQETFAGMCYDEDIYMHLIRKYGDKDGNINKLAEYFGVNLHDSKDQLALIYLKEHQGETEEDAVKAKEDLIHYCQDIKLEVSNDLFCMCHINDRLADFDLQYRTVEGVECQTRDGADFARQEKPLIHEFMNQVREPKEGDLLDYEKDLLAKKEDFLQQFSSELVPVYAAKMDGYLSQFDDIFCTVGLFKKLERTEAGKKRLKKLIEQKPYSTKEDILASEKYMYDLLPNVGLTETDTTDANNYILQKKNEFALQYIKQIQGTTEDDAKEAERKLSELCHELGISDPTSTHAYAYIKELQNQLDKQYRFVDGIECSTREAADIAKSELPKIQEFMEQLEPPTSDSLLDYEKDLLAKKQSFESQFTSEIISKYVTQIDKLLADFDKQFCTIGPFKKVSREEAADHKALKLIKEMDLSSLENIDTAYRKLEEFLPHVGIAKEQATETVKYLEKQRTKCTKESPLGKIGGIFKK